MNIQLTTPVIHDLESIGKIMADARPDINSDLTDEAICAMALLFLRLRLVIGQTPESISLLAAANVTLGYEKREALEALLEVQP
jgi:hypothetical protein